MRILVIHEDDREARRVGEAAVECFGGNDLVQMRTATTERDVRTQLAGPDCPDVIVAPQNLLENRPALQAWLAGHPFRGYYRWLVVAGSTDEYLRAFMGRVGDRLLLGPVTGPNIRRAMCENGG